MRVIDAESLNDFFYSETSGTEEMIEDTVLRFPEMEMDYPDDCRELCKKVIEMCRNVILTEEPICDEDKIVILPAKIGDRVWRVFKVEGREPIISPFEFTLSYYDNWKNEFGVTIFTTKEEAEEAARKLVQDGKG